GGQLPVVGHDHAGQVIVGGAADQDAILTVDGLELVRPGPANEQVPAQAADEDIVARAAGEDVVGGAAAGVQGVAAVRGVQEGRHGDVVGRPHDPAAGQRDLLAAGLAVHQEVPGRWREVAVGHVVDGDVEVAEGVRRREGDGGVGDALWA